MSAQKVIFKDKFTTFFINPMNVVFIIAQGSYCTIKLTTGEEIKLARNLKFVLSQFLNIDYLYRMHRSFVINLNFVERVIHSPNKTNTYEVILSSSDAFPIPWKQYADFLNAVKEFFSGEVL